MASEHRTHLRTHTCGELRKGDEGSRVTLCGWAMTVRYHGNVTFVDCRDRYGTTQLVLSEDLKTQASAIRKESVIRATGTVRTKPQPNKRLATGEIEVAASDITVLATADPLPLDLEDYSNMTEDTRLKYRYLDLRRKRMQENLLMRHRITKAVRDYFDAQGFVDIETPFLGKSTPEGARDYLVPSRVTRGSFYALPQSPQIFKQLLQVAGFDRYMQIVKCFRDEDLRADRQPEFTQIDVEMSFVDEEDIYAVMEGLMRHVWKQAKGVSLTLPFPRLTFAEAMARYGSDKPDVRFGVGIRDITAVAKRTDFAIFRGAETVRCVVAPGKIPRKQQEELERTAKVYGAKGLLVMGYDPTKREFLGSAAKRFSGALATELAKSLGKDIGAGEATLLVVAGEERVVAAALGAVRLAVGKALGLIDTSKDAFLWVTDFPLLEWSEQDGRYVAMHHPFTRPKDEDIPLLEKAPEKARAKAYDLTLNGVEIAGGSIRISERELQQKMFAALKISPEEAQRKFGFLMDAFRYGAPPHGGIAFGLDRLVSLVCGEESIREVIAFPKTKNAEDLMMDSPSGVSDAQLDELGIALKK
ncbi:aspartate--tRNA ligase [Candidatus Woesearchaeota archaeon]|nr:aspartate--tRNA ligase [Candidatus Woesearchaeota archaeon]